MSLYRVTEEFPAHVTCSQWSNLRLWGKIGVWQWNNRGLILSTWLSRQPLRPGDTGGNTAEAACGLHYELTG